MPKRAERRHHEERVKSKFKRVAARLLGSVNHFINRWKWERKDGRYVGKHVVDLTGGARRMTAIEKLSAKMAHHPRHDCEMCCMGEKEEKHQREFEVARKSPEIDDE